MAIIAAKADSIENFDQLMEFVRDPKTNLPVLSPSRFSTLLNIDLKTLASQAHVHRNTLRLSPQSQTIQNFMREIIRVLRAASDISGNVPKTLFWYRNEPLPVFGYKTAERLVEEGRTDDVIRYLSSLSAGAAG